jgi:hypothetical protein
MAMKRFAVVLVLVVLAGACDKPSEENCRKALANVRTLLGTNNPTLDTEGDVRACKGGSSKKTVECAMNATSREQLKACGFFKADKKSDDQKSDDKKPDDKKPDETGGGSAAGSAK